MKTNVLWLGLALIATAPLSAAFESVGIEVTVEPEIPAALRMQGLRDGQVKLVLDIDATGRLTDCLVISASHAPLIRTCTEAARQWRFKPARYNGEATAARVELSINLTLTGAVISRTAAEMVAAFMEQVVGRPFDYELCPAAEVDRPLVAVNRVSPDYARDAAKEGATGRVRVHFFVDEKGNVRLPAVPADTHPYLSAIAVQAMRAWKFEPPTRQGRPVLVAAVQEFNFDGRP